MADLICYDTVMMELKAFSALVDEHRAQDQLPARDWLSLVDLLVNFGHHPKLEWERILHFAHEIQETQEEPDLKENPHN